MAEETAATAEPPVATTQAPTTTVAEPDEADTSDAAGQSQRFACVARYLKTAIDAPRADFRDNLAHPVGHGLALDGQFRRAGARFGYVDAPDCLAPLIQDGDAATVESSLVSIAVEDRHFFDGDILPQVDFPGRIVRYFGRMGNASVFPLAVRVAVHRAARNALGAETGLTGLLPLSHILAGTVDLDLGEREDFPLAGNGDVDVSPADGFRGGLCGAAPCGKQNGNGGSLVHQSSLRVRVEEGQPAADGRSC